MANLVFTHEHALQAIAEAELKGRDWLYATYPKPDGQSRISSTGFLMHQGKAYPAKPLGRLANALAGQPMTDNPITNVFRQHFRKLGFQLIESPEDEANQAVERQRRLAAVWERPDQAKFRRAVFNIFGSRCLVSGCETLAVVEAAHILPVSKGGSDEGTNGIPLRADLHRLFDANVITIDPNTWTLFVAEEARNDYGQYHGLDLRPVIGDIQAIEKLAASFQKRNLLAAGI